VKVVIDMSKESDVSEDFVSVVAVGSEKGCTQMFLLGVSWVILMNFSMRLLLIVLLFWFRRFFSKWDTSCRSSPRTFWQRDYIILKHTISFSNINISAQRELVGFM